MKYPEFLSSAKRHNQACKVLQDKLDSFGDNDRDNDEFRFLVLSLYYLSGYIIECSLKFKIFEVIGYDENTEVDEVECQKAGINYKKKIKTHNFSRLQNFLESKISDISYLSEESTIESLLSQWNPELRYKTIQLDHNEIKSFYKHTNQFLKRM